MRYLIVTVPHICPCYLSKIQECSLVTSLIYLQTQDALDCPSSDHQFGSTRWATWINNNQSCTKWIGPLLQPGSFSRAKASQTVLIVSKKTMHFRLHSPIPQIVPRHVSRQSCIQVSAWPQSYIMQQGCHSVIHTVPMLRRPVSSIQCVLDPWQLCGVQRFPWADPGCNMAEAIVTGRSQVGMRQGIRLVQLLQKQD